MSQNQAVMSHRAIFGDLAGTTCDGRAEEDAERLRPKRPGLSVNAVFAGDHATGDAICHRHYAGEANAERKRKCDERRVGRSQGMQL